MTKGPVARHSGNCDTPDASPVRWTRAGASQILMWRHRQVPFGASLCAQLVRAERELAFRRIEVEPAQEMQVDYGSGARCQDQEGKWRKTHVFRLVLSHSRKGYSEAVRRLYTLKCHRLSGEWWKINSEPR